jgi:hypothetical protein
MTTNATTKPSEPRKVDEYMKKLHHPLAELVQALRQNIIEVDPSIGEEIKWNAPTFFFTGEMKHSNPKEYRRYLVVFNLYQKDRIRLVFWRGSKVKDVSGFLEGDYADGRRLAEFHDMKDVKSKKVALQAVVKQQLMLVDK